MEEFAALAQRDLGLTEAKAHELWDMLKKQYEEL